MGLGGALNSAFLARLPCDADAAGLGSHLSSRQLLSVEYYTRDSSTGCGGGSDLD